MLSIFSSVTLLAKQQVLLLSRSHYLRSVRDRIEEPWQQWELAQIDVAVLQKLEDVKQALRDRAAADLASARRHQS